MKRRVECRLEKELVDRIDRVAQLLGTDRTDIISNACDMYLKRMKRGASMITKDDH